MLLAAGVLRQPARHGPRLGPDSRPASR
jgi:hypothetical protein